MATSASVLEAPGWDPVVVTVPCSAGTVGAGIDPASMQGTAKVAAPLLVQFEGVQVAPEVAVTQVPSSGWVFVIRRGAVQPVLSPALPKELRV